jgi:hypothetical protein
MGRFIQSLVTGVWLGVWEIEVWVGMEVGVGLDADFGLGVLVAVASGLTVA